jgi:hypothetical protein
MIATKWRERIIVHASNFRKVKRVGDVLKVFSLVAKKKSNSKLLMRFGDGQKDPPGR